VKLVLTRVGLSPEFQPLQQLAVVAAEAAVAEHADHVATLNVLPDVLDDGVHVVSLSHRPRGKLRSAVL
jgi:hypothetical protein